MNPLCNSVVTAIILVLCLVELVLTSRQSFHDNVVGQAVLMRLKQIYLMETSFLEKIRTELNDVSITKYLFLDRKMNLNGIADRSHGFNAAFFHVFGNVESMELYNNNEQYIRFREEMIMPFLNSTMDVSNNHYSLLSLNAYRCKRTNNVTDTQLCKTVSDSSSIAHIIGMNFNPETTESDINRICESLCKLQNISGVMEMYCSANIAISGASYQNQGYQLALISVLKNEQALITYDKDYYHNYIRDSLKQHLNSSNAASVVAVDITGGSSTCLLQDTNVRFVHIFIISFFSVTVFVAIAFLYSTRIRRVNNNQDDFIF